MAAAVFSSRVPGGQFVRYLCVGGFNTAFGYTDFAVILFLLRNLLPQRYLYLTVMIASVIAFPMNVTVAYFCYKFLVFRTRGNYWREWIRCIAVYGSATIPSLLALPVLTRVLQAVFHRYGIPLHQVLAQVEGHLSGWMLVSVQRISIGGVAAGYIAGGIVAVSSTLYSFLAHRSVTFREAKA
jgi:putative flippase GtrA